MADSNLGSAPRGAGLSLYANLLDPQKSNATLSRGPIVFKAAGSDAADEASAKKPQIDSGRFVPLNYEALLLTYN